MLGAESDHLKQIGLILRGLDCEMRPEAETKSQRSQVLTIFSKLCVEGLKNVFDKDLRHHSDVLERIACH